MTILQRYVLGEFIKTFLLALVVLTLVFFMGTLLQVVRKFSVLEPEFMLQVLPHMFLSAFTFTFPFSVLVGCTLTFSRIAHDNEVTAIRAGGVHLHHIIWPVCLVALLFSVFSFLMASSVVPKAYLQKRKLATRAIKLFFKTLVGSEPGTIPYFPGYRIYFSGYRDGEFQDLVIHRVAHEHLTEEIMASRGQLLVDEANFRAQLILHKGSIAHMRYKKIPGLLDDRELEESTSDDVIIQLRTGAERQETVRFGFEKYIVDMEIPSTTRKRTVENPKGLGLGQLQDRIVELGNDLVRLKGEIALFEAQFKQAKTNQDRQWCRNRIGERRLEHKHKSRGVKQFRTNFHGRIALSLACLVVTLLGVPLGIMVRHSNKLVSFAIAAMPVVGLYYPLMMAGEAMGESGTLHPVIGMWIGNVVVGAIGVGLLMKLYRR